MECLAGKYLKAIPDELLIFCIGCSLKYLVTSIFFIIEEGMFYMAEMDSYLVCATCLEFAFKDRKSVV